MPLTKDTIRAALSSILPGEALLWVSVCETYASIKAQLPGATDADMNKAASGAREAVARLGAAEGIALDSFIVEFVDHAGTVVKTVRFGGMKADARGPAQEQPAAQQPSQAAGHTPIPGLAPQPKPLANVRHIVAVGAGKGGVGKSTVALNVAVGLARRGFAVGLLDADIYGPSMPTMLGLASLDAVVQRGMLQPFYTHSVKCMTIGKLVDPDKALIWRGPMAHGAFKQLAEQTEWGELDYLIIDLPPGTGDVALTMAQTLSLTGAVVVCTPQKVAQDDAVRAARMFSQLNVPILGVVENMSCFVGDDGKVYDIFGRGGAQQMAQRLGVPFLGDIPITMSLRVNSDKGDPTSNFTGTDAAGKRLSTALEEMVTNLEGQVALSGMKQGKSRPKLTIS
ncbi:MAG TPA: Mrp/NBP35 family ATP-binding protein [Phycisphaerales bacterium]|nr:Mrp/NBP35 family ATP-binding protein [Phycisphaerales bacterium]